MISRLHSNVTNHAISLKWKKEIDTFYVMDSCWGDTISTVTGEVEKFDTNCGNLLSVGKDCRLKYKSTYLGSLQ